MDIVSRLFLVREVRLELSGRRESDQTVSSRIPHGEVLRSLRVGHTVGRNDSEPGTEQSNRLLNGGVALGLVQAVATRLIEGAECVRVEASDIVLSTEAIILEDFVGSIHGAAADDA
jgi:hypothetical protein